MKQLYSVNAWKKGHECVFLNYKVDEIHKIRCQLCSFCLFSSIKHSLFFLTGFFILLPLFRPHLHTTRTICPSFPLLGRALKNASVSISKVHSIPHSGGNFPKDATLFPPSLALKRSHPETHPLTHTLHACMHAYVLYLSLCWANTLLCLTCFLCHDDERHLLFSAETPSPPYVAAIPPALFTSRVVIQPPGGESQLRWHGPKGNAGQLSGSVPRRDISQRENGGNNVDDFPVTLYETTFIPPMLSEITLFQVRWDVFPVNLLDAL